jgi:hypothetical protein
VVHQKNLAREKSVGNQAGTARGRRTIVLACLLVGLLDDTDISFNVGHHAARKISVHGEAFLQPESFAAIPSAH